RDFHSRFINDCCDAIADQLPPNYIARIDERFRVLETPDARGQSGYPDVTVVQTGRSRRRDGDRAGVMMLEPVAVRLTTVLREEVRETLIEIRRLPDWTLVTSVELLSPANK